MSPAETIEVFMVATPPAITIDGSVERGIEVSITPSTVLISCKCPSPLPLI